MKNNFISTIESAGLSQTEAKIYGALMEIKEGTMTDLAKQAGIKRSSGYNSMGKLENWGLVSKIKRGKRTFYSAVHPRRLLQLANLRRNDIEDNLGRMVGAYYGEGEKPQIQMFEGIEAVRNVYLEAFTRLKAGEEMCIFTNIGAVISLFPEVPAEFKKVIGNIVYKSNVRELSWGDKAGYEYAKHLQDKIGNGYQLKLTDPHMTFGTNEQCIFNDKIIYFSLQKHIFVVEIQNRDLVLTHKAMFDLAWQQAMTIPEFEKKQFVLN